MNTGQTVFTQLLEPLSHYQFSQCVKHYHGNQKTRTFSCWSQFLCMAYAQLTGCASLRGIEACLNAQHEKLYHMGFRGRIARSTLADANESRDFRIYQDFAGHLIERACTLYQHEPLALDVHQSVYAFDSTTIELCLSMCPWARFRRHKGAVKMHTLLQLPGAIPTFVAISTGKLSDVKVLDVLPVETEAIITMDRAYLDFARLYAIHQHPAFFVIRAKKNLSYRRMSSRPVDKRLGLRADQSIILKRRKSRRAYPQTLRRVSYVDDATDKRLVFLTNLFDVSAKTVADIHRHRWQVELFFKWIKQHLRFKVFYGTSANAVKTQIWIALSVYLLVAIAKKTLNLPGTLHTILEVLEVNAFEKKSIFQLVSDAHRTKPITCAATP